MVLGELILVFFVVMWFVHAAQKGRHFDHAWIGLFVGLGLMLSHRMFTLGAVVAGVSLGVLTLPMARAEWQRIQGGSAEPTRGASPGRRE